MQIGSKLQFNVPNQCLQNCEYKSEIFDLNAICFRCPVFTCNKDEEGFCMIEPEDYRDDWAKEWEIYFREKIMNNKDEIDRLNAKLKIAYRYALAYQRSSSGIGGQALTPYTCLRCDKEQVASNTCLNIICPECAKEIRKEYKNTQKT